MRVLVDDGGTVDVPRSAAAGDRIGERGAGCPGLGRRSGAQESIHEVLQRSGSQRRREQGFNFRIALS